jgi:hypothetical protein
MVLQFPVVAAANDPVDRPAERRLVIFLCTIAALVFWFGPIVLIFQVRAGHGAHFKRLRAPGFLIAPFARSAAS